MLVEKYNKDDIIVFRTVGSDEVIAKVISDKPEEFTLSKPLALAQTPQGIGMTFYMIMADQENEFVVQKANISLFNEDGNEEKTVSLVSKGVKANDEKTKKAYHLRVWCDFATRNDNLYKKQKDPSEEDVLEWNEKRNNDEIYGTGIACYAYASTVHKTQGDSFEYVVIDLEDEDRNLKWLYTALTRTTVDFLLYGKKSFSDWF